MVAGLGACFDATNRAESLGYTRSGVLGACVSVASAGACDVDKVIARRLLGVVSNDVRRNALVAVKHPGGVKLTRVCEAGPLSS